MSSQVISNRLVFGIASIYFGGVVTYNITDCYNVSKSKLLEYRNKGNSLFFVNNKICDTEWDVVTQAAKIDVPVRFFDSLLWPCTLSKHIVPHIVLKLNKKPE